MKITKEYSCKLTEVPASKMTRTFNALKRMNWVQNGAKGWTSNFAGIPDKIINKKLRHIDRYRQYTLDCGNDEDAKRSVWIQNNQSVSWTITFDSADEYEKWIDEHMIKIVDFNF